MGRYLKPVALQPPQLHGFVQSHPTSSSPPIWVELATLPNPYSYHQAMLICRHSEDEWLAWIPDHGEAILHVSEFYFDTDWN